MSTDKLTIMIRELNQSMLGLAAIGGTLRLQQSGHTADPAVTHAMDATLAAMGVPPLAALSPDQARQALGLIRTFFVEAADLMDVPERPPGWTFKDPAILQGIGASSAGMVARMTGLAAGRPWFGRVLSQPGTFLDIGTGVGGIALAAAQAWPALDVLGIDCWQPSLALAELDRAESPCPGRVRFECRGLEDVTEAEEYSLAWLPTPFIDGAAVAASIPRLLRALEPGGGLVVGVIPPAGDRLGAALGRLRTVRNGGHIWACDEIASLLDQAGFAAIDVPPNQAGIHFVLGQRPC